MLFVFSGSVQWKEGRCRPGLQRHCRRAHRRQDAEPFSGEYPAHRCCIDRGRAYGRPVLAASLAGHLQTSASAAPVAGRSEKMTLASTACENKTDGLQRYRSGDCWRWRGRYCGGPAGSRTRRSIVSSLKPGRGLEDAHGRIATIRHHRSILAADGCIRPTATRGERLPRATATRSTGRRRPGRDIRPRSAFRFQSRTAFLKLSGNSMSGSTPYPKDSGTSHPRFFLASLGRWNDLIDAVSTYVSGAELDRVSSPD